MCITLTLCVLAIEPPLYSGKYNCHLTLLRPANSLRNIQARDQVDGGYGELLHNQSLGLGLYTTFSCSFIVKVFVDL